MRRLWKPTLRTRLLVLVCLAIAPALALAWCAALEYRTIMVRKAEAMALEVVRDAARTEDRLVVGTQHLLAALALMPEMCAADPTAANPILKEMLKSYPRYANFGLVARDGTVVASALPTKTTVNVADRLWFVKAVRTHRFSVGEYQIGRVTGVASINFAYPVLDAHGKLFRVVFCALGLEWLERLVAAAGLPPGATLTVTDHKGIVLAHSPGPGTWIGQRAPEWPALQKMMAQGEEATGECVGFDGIPRLCAMSSLGGEASGVHVLVGIPRAVAFAEADQAVRGTAVGLVAVVLLAVLAVLFGTHLFILRQLSPLVQAARRLTAGDLAARTGLPHGGGELAQLAAAFDEMAAALEQRSAERDQAEAALRRENEFTSTVLSTLGALVVVLDRQGRIVRFNRACQRTTGYFFHEVEGRRVWDFLLPADEVEQAKSVFAQLWGGTFSNQCETHWLTKDGGRRRIAWSNSAVIGEDGQVEYIIGTGIDVTETRKAEEKLRLSHARLEALLTLGEMTRATEHEITDYALESAVSLTKSTIGYLAFMNEDETILTMHAWSKTAMEQCAIVDKPLIYPVATTGLWGEAVRQRRPVITNDYHGPVPGKRGYPPGHVEVRRHMNIPVFDGDRIVAVAGVGNKEDPYDESDVMQLRLLMDGMWRLLQRRKAEAELRAAHEELEARVQQRTAELSEANERLRLEIAERKRTQEALQRSEQRFRSLVETTSDWIWEVDRNARYTYVSPKVKELLGYEPTEVLGKRPFDLMTPQDAERVSAAFAEIARTRQPFSGLENVNLHRDGQRVTLESAGVPIFDEAGNLRGYRGINRDITERKRTAEHISRQAAELARSNAELEQFAYVASHDLQEPLRKIVAFGQRLEACCGPSLSEEARDYLGRMQNAAVRMQALINDLLAYSRVTTQGQPFAPVDLRQVASEVLSDLEVAVEQTGARIELGELATIEADPLQMRQLFQNLIGNALKFHRPGVPPVIEIQGRLLPNPTGDNGGPRYEMTVKDNGIGFDEKYAERIFGVFQRLHTREEYPGTGIGLALCRKIVERHGGTVTAHSQPHQGTTFVVNLPVKHREPTHDQQSQTHNHLGGRR